LPAGDNFGSAEEVHPDRPDHAAHLQSTPVRRYLLGAYGQSRTEAELLARRAVGRRLSNGFFQ
jgi:hypothetical protein